MKRHLASLAAILVFALLAAGSLPSSTPPSSSAPTPTTPDAKEAPLSDAKLADILRTNIASLKDPAEIPKTKDLILLRLASFGATAKFVAEAEGRIDPDISKLAADLKQALSREQVRQFPRLRRAWAATADETMWEHNVDVRVLGEGNRTLELVGGVFASNKNIKQIQETLTDALHALRFRRIQYRWYKGADEYTYYTLKTPADSDVVTAER
jgi:hypothetical protein